MPIYLTQLNDVLSNLLPLPSDLKVVVLADPKRKPLLRERRPRNYALHGRNKVVVEAGLADWVANGGVRSVRDLIDATGAWVHLARNGEPLGASRIIVMRDGRRVSGKTLLA